MHFSDTHIRKLSEYDSHHAISHLRDEAQGLEAFVAIHRKNGAIPSFGATRLWPYASAEHALRDALRLSRLMSYKAALAGLPCGGAKAVIMSPASLTNERREEILRAYAEQLHALRNDFITGTDVGIRQDDLSAMKMHTPNIVGFNDNTAEFTALGVHVAIQYCLTHVFGDKNAAKRSVAIQGIGKVGGKLLELLYPGAGTIYVSDIDTARVQAAERAFPGIVIVPPEEIHRQPVDVFAPCALGPVINASTVGELSCRIVAGAANNQLASEEIGDALYERGILYAPDYVVNAGGLIAVYDEYEHAKYDEDRVRDKTMNIPDRLESIVAQSAAEHRSTNRIANEIAENEFKAYD